ncbi:putative F-box/LRR-repeat protein 23 [Lactuca sativa]|uniref:F-box domain-containing protein n=1 Tax=Lactuca sativa TaxID=4236 RepID=A0A9R1XQ92_LACSA|nr:putative F-box/LRR-repeat protein 23 [Lactuca sativa]KAJ0223315.1 hypothetical protein LSAT_V11C200074390 [Lactuca sativa]
MTSPSKQQEPEERNWVDVPYDVMANILHKVDAFDILENAQKVCTSWRKICKDPMMWRVIDFSVNHARVDQLPPLREMCEHAVDRSQGQFVDITIVGFTDNELLQYVADRSSQLRRLEISYCFEVTYISWSDALKKLPVLEELSIYVTHISKEAIESAGHYCPMLKTLKLNNNPLRSRELSRFPNERAIAIGKNLPELRHLELIGDKMTNVGLEVILNGCRHLESLDLRACSYIDLSVCSYIDGEGEPIWRRLNV